MIMAAKIMYNKHYMSKLFFMASKLEKMKVLDLHTAITCWSKAWKEVKISALSNDRNKLLKGKESIHVIFEGIATSDFIKALHGGKGGGFWHWCQQVAES